MNPKPWENEPTELPDGRLVCPHGLVVCGICTVDYSFMDDILAENESHSGSSDLHPDDEDLSSTEKDEPGASNMGSGVPVNGIGAHWPPHGEDGMPSPPRTFGPIRSPSEDLKTCERFQPPQQPNAAAPWHLFSHASGRLRFSRKIQGVSELLLYTDGACLDNGRPNARGGCAFVYRPEDPSKRSGHEYVSFALEKKGPSGAEVQHTSNRAELRAIISALHFRAWQGEGFGRIVVATDSSYAVEGITKHMRTWLQRDWRNSRGTSLMNRDLWQALLDRLRHFYQDGLEVKFWLIPREWNSKADLAAKEAAATEPDDKYSNILGVMI